MAIIKDNYYTVVEITGPDLQNVLDALANHFRTHPDRSLVSLHYETEIDETGEVIEHYIGATVVFSLGDAVTSEEDDIE